jgi:hypothetical protein
VLTLPFCQPPAAPTSSGSSSSSGIDPQLSAWLSASQQQFDELLALLQQQHAARLAWLREAPAAAASAVWWPFTQHAQLPHGWVRASRVCCVQQHTSNQTCLVLFLLAA